nr:AEC family transporter [uncultured Desulfobulbus sp.]
MLNFILILFFVGLGSLFRRVQAFPESTAQVLNMFALYLALPAVILLKVPQVSFSIEMVIPIIVSWVMLLLSAFLVYTVGRRLAWSRETIGVLLLVVPMGNTSFMGVPMVNAFFGEVGLPYLIVYDQLGTMVGFATYGSVILAIYGSERKVQIGRVVRQSLSFPPTLALLMGLVLRFWTYPAVVVEQLEILGSMLTPLVMTAIGFQLTIRLSRGVLAPLGFGLAVKMVITPLVALGGTHLLGLNSLATDISIFEAGMPPMVTSAAIAIAAGLLPELAAALVSLGLAIGFVTLPLLYWIMEWVG